MNDIFKDNNPVLNRSENKMINAARLCFPVATVSTVILLFAYILDIFIIGPDVVINFGESTVISSNLYAVGSLISKLILPMISTGIALNNGGILSLPAGVMGGILISSGATAQNIYGSVNSISGVMGSIFAGWLAGYTTNLALKLIKKRNRDSLCEIICPTISLILTIFTVFGINSMGVFFNSVSSALLAYSGENNSFLLPILIGLFISISPSGPLFISAYIFGTSSITAFDPQVMAAVTAAGMIPSLSIGLFAYIFKDRLEPFEKASAYMGIIPALFGLPQLSYPFYVSRFLRFVVSVIPGSCIASVLSILFKCSTHYPSGGLFTFSSSGKPLFFLVAIICGVIVSTALLRFFIKSESVTEESETKEQNSLGMTTA